MRCCLIAPVPDLERFVDNGCTHHLTLSHLMNLPGYGEFYVDRSLKGDYVILDNGAKELGSGSHMASLLVQAATIEAKEVVLTDVRYQCEETLEAGRLGLAWLETTAGRKLYEEAGCPKLMIVPQGATPGEWTVCLTGLLSYVGKSRALISEMPEPSVGFAYHYDHLFEGGLYDLLSDARIDNLDIHLLGWPRRLETLIALADDFPHIRSVDSGRPFSYAVAGKRCRPGQENPGRAPDFFTTSILDEELVRLNINTFRGYANDPAVNHHLDLS